MKLKHNHTLYPLVAALTFGWSLAGSSIDLSQAKLSGEAGESSHLYLVPEGIYFHPLYNDISGSTDKFLTGSLKVGTLVNLEDFSVDTAFFWRLLTPAIKPYSGANRLATPVGRYADWMEVKTAIALQPSNPLRGPKHQIQVGYSDISDKGGPAFHRKIHRWTNNTLEGLDYTDQPEGRFYSIGYDFSWLTDYTLNEFHPLLAAWTLGFEQDRVLTEVFVEHSLLYKIKPGWWELAVEVKLIRQVQSDVYAGLKPLRFEAGIGSAIYRVYAPTLRYVSSYLRGDDVGQTYFDFIHYNYAF